MNKNSNIDPNTMNNIKNLVDNGDISAAISQLSPEMIQNFSAMLSSTNSQKETKENIDSSNNQSNSNNSTSASNNSSFNFNNIDMNTILKMKNIMDKMNNSNDSRSNLLHSLKPYLRESRKEKLDQYSSLLNIAQMAELFQNENNVKKENDNNDG